MNELVENLADTLLGKGIYEAENTFINNKFKISRWYIDYFNNNNH